jgi:hypothetical protein
MLQLEKFCYYQHLSLSGGQERPIFACRIVDIRGSRFHVLSRIQDAGLDFTGRTNFIAHHLVFTPEEIRQFPTPPVILRDWPGWMKSWTKEPQLLENEDWAELTALAGKTNVPAQTWQRVTGDAVNGYGLLEARAGTSFRVDDQPDETILELLAESLELLEVRDTRRDFHTAAWNYTFTTSMQEQDNPADFRWRCIHSDNPAANRFATPDCRVLSAVRGNRCTDEEMAFARGGRQPPHFVEQPKYQHIKEGGTATFTAKAGGIPTPNYQWFECDQDGKEKNKLNGQTSSKLVLDNCKRGTTRYIVWATNGVGDDCRSDPVKLEVEPPKPALTIAKPGAKVSIGVRTTAQKPQLDVWEDSEPTSSDSTVSISVWWLVAIFIAVLAIGGGAWWIITHRSPKSEPGFNGGNNQVVVSTNAGSGMPVPVPPPTPAASTNQPSSPETTNKHTPLSEGAVSLPSPWTSKNVGNTAKTKTPLYENGTFTLTAQAGEILPEKTNDSFFFASQPSSNSVEFIARFSITEKIGKSRCGIMLRESDSADAPFVFVGSSETSILWIQRASSRATSTQTNIQTINQPVYFRLVHQDNRFSGDFSSDGKKWQPVGVSEQIRMNGSNYLLGFALCSGKNKETVHADFDTVTINGAKQ